MKSAIFSILFIIILVTTVSAVSLSTSPEITFIGSKETKLCQETNILSNDFSGQITLSDKWEKVGENDRILAKHTETAESLGLSVEYPPQIEIEKANNQLITLCISAKEAGSYHGVIKFRPSGTNLAVGTWIVVNVSAPESILSNSFSSISLTGKAITENIKSNIVPVMLFSTFILLIILTIVLFKITKKTENQN